VPVSAFPFSLLFLLKLIPCFGTAFSDVNSIYAQMHEQWKLLETYNAMARHQAVTYLATQRFLSSYLKTLQVNEDPFVDTIIDEKGLKKLLQAIPSTPYERMAVVPPLHAYFNTDSFFPQSDPLDDDAPHEATSRAASAAAEELTDASEAVLVDQSLVDELQEDDDTVMQPPSSEPRPLPAPAPSAVIDIFSLPEVDSVEVVDSFAPPPASEPAVDVFAASAPVDEGAEATDVFAPASSSSAA